MPFFGMIVKKHFRGKPVNMSRGLAALNFVTLLQYDTGVFAAVFYFGYHPHKGRWGDDMVNLHFTGLSKSYGARTVLDNISGSINPADKIGLVGKNGVGKTTLARILAGREARDEGQIEASLPGPKFSTWSSTRYLVRRIQYTRWSWRRPGEPQVAGCRQRGAKNP